MNQKICSIKHRLNIEGYFTLEEIKSIENNTALLFLEVDSVQRELDLTKDCLKDP